jgi:hypothetical protein
MALILGRAHADVRRGYKLRTQMKPSAKKADNDRGGEGGRSFSADARYTCETLRLKETQRTKGSR